MHGKDNGARGWRGSARLVPTRPAAGRYNATSSSMRQVHGSCCCTLCRCRCCCWRKHVAVMTSRGARLQLQHPPDSVKGGTQHCDVVCLAAMEHHVKGLAGALAAVGRCKWSTMLLDIARCEKRALLCGPLPWHGTAANMHILACCATHQACPYQTLACWQRELHMHYCVQLHVTGPTCRASACACPCCSQRPGRPGAAQ